MQAALASPFGFGLTAGVCHALGVSRASLAAEQRSQRYRGHARLARPSASPPSTKPRSPRALSAEQRRAVLDRLREPRFADLAPAEIYATLLDEGTYQCSIPLGALAPGRTMYRILTKHGAVRERRNQLRHPTYQKPELLAADPAVTLTSTTPAPRAAAWALDAANPAAAARACAMGAASKAVTSAPWAARSRAKMPPTSPNPMIPVSIHGTLLPLAAGRQPGPHVVQGQRSLQQPLLARVAQRECDGRFQRVAAKRERVPSRPEPVEQ